MSWVVLAPRFNGLRLNTDMQDAIPVVGSTAQEKAWSPQIAFQYYETAELDAQFLAEHVDWLMMRYGAEALRDKVIAEGYTGVLPQYLQMFQIYGPGPYTNKNQSCKNRYTSLRNNVMWTNDFCERVHPNESWFLHNDDGERLYVKEQNWDGSTIIQYYMNPGSEGFREFWVDQVRKQQDANWNSFFLDNVAATYGYLMVRADNADGGVKEYSSDEEWQAAVIGLLQTIRDSFPERELWGNIIEAPKTPDAWDAYRPHLDGIQEESFATYWVDEPPLSVEGWDAMLTRAERTLADGRRVVLYGQGLHNDFARMRFSLASYLLVASPDDRATFRYAFTGDYEYLWWYPQYDINYGIPKGPRFQEGDLWIREFTCARVTVDPARQRGTIEQLSCSN